MAMTIFEELTKVAKLTPDDGETFDHFAKRLAKRLDNDRKVTNEQFATLSGEAQSTAQLLCLAVKDGSELPDLPGYEATAAAAAEEDAAEESEAADDAAEEEPEAEDEAAGEEEEEEAEETNPEEESKVEASVDTERAPRKKKAAAPAKKAAKFSGKKKVVAKAKSVKAKKANGTRGRKGKYPDEAVITILCKENPRRPNTKAFSKFAKLKTGMTVKDAKAKGIKTSNLNTDVVAGNLRVAVR